MAQRYADPIALERMAKGRCPECGWPVEDHDGWGGPRCSLTDNGVASRIGQFEQDQAGLANKGGRDMSKFRLDPTQVEQTFRDCLTDDADSVEVDMIVGTARFDKAKLAEHAELIWAMLGELPDQFRQSKGGGWSFLNACIDRHGDQWTGLHQTMAELFALGVGAGVVRCQLPREMWAVQPGGMPYYVITDGPSSARNK